MPSLDHVRDELEKRSIPILALEVSSTDPDIGAVGFRRNGALHFFKFSISDSVFDVDGIIASLDERNAG